ncbi:MAG: hypothetical protein ACK50F_01880, partial [Betaproteobacteria bacterium]
MADALQQALRGASQAPPVADALAPRRAVLVVGAGGALPAAGLAEAWVAARDGRVAALGAAPMGSTVRGGGPRAGAGG